jgi:predicted PurR-regulated permease PerM
VTTRTTAAQALSAATPDEPVTPGRTAPSRPSGSAPVGRAATSRPDAERGAVIGRGLTWVSTWSLRLLLIAGAAVLLGLLVGYLWSIVLPVVLGLLVASVLWPPTAWLRRHGVPAALAATAVLLGSLLVLFGVLAAIAPSVAAQSGELADQTVRGLQQLQTYLSEPPFNIGERQLDNALGNLQERLRGSAGSLASGVLSGVFAVGSGLVTALLALVLVFFFLKDGPQFLPWLHGVVGERTGRHLDLVLTRSWATLGSFINSQALVGLADAVLIGIGLVVLGVPLALPLAVLTFLGGFVPIIGAFVVGFVAVLVALVSNGLTTALLVTALIFAVQQIEGNVLQPILQGRSLALHPAVVILAVTLGSALFGIVGAFLSVPVAAVIGVVLRYLDEVIDGRPHDGAQADTLAEERADAGALSAEPVAGGDGVPASER